MSLGSSTIARYTTDISGEASYQAALSPLPYVFDIDASGNKIKHEGYEWDIAGGERYTTFVISNSSIDESVVSPTDMNVRVRIFIPEELSNESDINVGNLVFTLHEQGNASVYVSQSDYLSTQTPLFDTEKKNGWVYDFIKTSTSESGAIHQSELLIPLKGGEVSDAEITLAVSNTEIDCSNFVIYVERVS